MQEIKRKGEKKLEGGYRGKKEEKWEEESLLGCWFYLNIDSSSAQLAAYPHFLAHTDYRNGKAYS